MNVWPRSRFALPLFLLAALLLPTAVADPLPVHHLFGSMRGFLVVRSRAGAIVGHGEFLESTSGDRVTIRLTLHFRDGSLDDETAIMTQHETYRFVSDHHIQHGPTFKNAIDQTIQADGQVTERTIGKDGKPGSHTNHFDLPPDLSNGLLCALVLNLPQDSDATLGMLIPQGKGRLIHLKVSPDGTAPFYAVPGDRRTAHLFRIKLDLGGLEGVVAPIIGKQPSDLVVWVLDGEVPVLVREVGQLSEGGPVLSLELAGTNFSHAASK